MFLSSHLLSTMQHINSLPCLVLRLIFSRLPLNDLLQVGRVCALWKEYQMDITRKVNSITLLVGSKTPNQDDDYLTPFDLISQSPLTLNHSNELLNDQGGLQFAQEPNLTIPHLTISIVNLLVESLSNVVTLAISISDTDPYVLDHVIYLLNQWKDKLVTLKLWYHCSDHYVRDETCKRMSKLFESLNSLASLEHLTLDLLNSQSYASDADFNFSFLTRIREFNYQFCPTHSHVPVWLKQHGASAQLERIGLAGRDFGNLLSQLASTPFVGKMTILPKKRFFGSEYNFANNFKQFTSLCRVGINFQTSNLTFADQIKSLSGLKHLVHLDINFNCFAPLTDFNRIPTHALTQLPSIKLLSLDSGNHSNHKDKFESKHWGWIFPNVQILSVKHNCLGMVQLLSGESVITKCPNLGRFSSSSPVPREAIVEGIRVLLTTFAQCPSLRRIYLNDQLSKFRSDDLVIKFNFNF